MLHVSKPEFFSRLKKKNIEDTFVEHPCNKRAAKKRGLIFKWKKKKKIKNEGEENAQNEKSRALPRNF